MKSDLALISERPLPTVKTTADVDLRLHAKQGLALMTDATEVGYGGAAGGGKSHLFRAASIYYSHSIPGLQTYLFRRKSNELIKNHIEGPTGYPVMLGPWSASGYVRIVKNEIRFGNGKIDPKDPFLGGSKIYLCHCQYEHNVFDWLGPEMHLLMIEQAEQFTKFMIQMLRGRNRIPEQLNIPEQFKRLFPRCMYSFNPGGVGHQFFKQDFVKAREPMQIEQMSDEEGGKRRIFIPAKLQDNPSVNPDEYRKTLRGLPPKMAKALEDGDFDVVVGAFFPNIDRRKHLIKAFEIPQWWPRLNAMDWGACGDGDPFSIGWATVSDGSMKAQTTTGESFTIPKDAIVWYRRWNGAKLPKVTATQVASGINKREAGEEILLRVAGGDILEKRGHGESIFDLFEKEGVIFQRADMRRQSGWMQVEERIVGKDGRPMQYWFECCEGDLESMQALQHDTHNPNDVEEGDDHDGDKCRYLCMTRPWSAEKPKALATLAEKFRPPTIDELWKMRENKSRRK